MTNALYRTARGWGFGGFLARGWPSREAPFGAFGGLGITARNPPREHTMKAAHPQKSFWATLGAAILGMSIGAACGFTEPQVQTDQLDQLAADTQEMRLCSFTHPVSVRGSTARSLVLR